MLIWPMTLGLAALMLGAVAIANGGPIIFPDSVAYLLDAERMSRLAAPYATRPVFYGVAVWLLHWGGQFWLPLFAQALALAHLLSLTLRTLDARPGPGGFLLLVAGLVLLTPVGWYVAHLLPDIFIGMLALALFLLGFRSDALRRWERVYLVLLAAAAASFHLVAAPIAVAVLAMVGFARLRIDRRIRPLLVALPIGLAVGGSLIFSEIVWQRFTLTPNSPPYLLARLLADGPGRDFLAARCPGAGFALCAYRDQLPATEEGFLWGLLPNVPEADGRAMKAQAGAVVSGTVRMFPLQVAGHMLENASRQFVTIGSETQFSEEYWDGFRRGQSPLARALPETLQSRGALERPRLDGINALHLAVAGLSLAATLVLLVRCVRAGAARPTALIAVVLMVLASNAVLSGALGGVFARYQGRVIWLLPFAAVAALRSLRQPLSSG